MRSKRTVTASVAATVSAPEMISCCEYQLPVLFEIVVFLMVGRTRIFGPLLGFARNSRTIIQFVGKPRHRLKTRPTQTYRFETICDQSAEDLTWNDDLLTPAKPFVQMTFGQTAPVVAAAPRALFVSAQALNLGRGLFFGFFQYL
jgi:hypothetical protein